jgi:hypothetical protein
MFGKNCDVDIQGGRVIGAVDKGVVVERMMVRLKPPKIGEVARVMSCEIYFYPKDCRNRQTPSWLGMNRAAICRCARARVEYSDAMRRA